MADRTESLGIKLKISLDGEIGKVLASLERNLSKLNFDKLGQSANGATKGMEKFGSATKSQMELIHRLFGISIDDIKKLQAQFSDQSAATKFSDNFKLMGSAHDAHVANYKKNVAKIRAAEEKLARDIKAMNANTQMSYAARASAIMGAYKNSGFKPVNGGHVMSTAITDPRAAYDQAHLDIAKKRNKQHAEAIKLNNQYGKSLKSTTGAAKKLEVTFGHALKRMTEFYAIRFVLFGITNQIREAAAATLDFHQTLRDTAAVAVASESAMKAMSDSAISIAKASRFTATEVAGAMQTLAQAGVEASDVPSVAKVVSQFATGTGATMTQAVDLMSTAMNVYNIEAKDSVRISNAWTAALNESKLEAGSLGTILNYLANTANQVGYSLEETAGMVATLSNQGMKASTIGTSTSTLLTNLLAPKPQMRAMLKEYKVGLDEINPRLNSFADIIARFEEADIPMERLLGSMRIRVGRTLVTAINAGSGAFRSMTTAMDSSSASFVANQKAMEGARARINTLKQDFSAFIIHMGDSLSGVGGWLLETMKDVVAGLDTASGKAALVTAGLAAMIPVVVALTQAFRTMMISNPALLFASLLSAALLTTVAVGLKGIGNEARKVGEEFEKMAKRWAKTEGEFIRKDSALRRFNEELKNTNQHIMESLDPSKEYVRLTDSLRSSLKTFLGEHSTLLGALSNEKIAYKDIQEEMARLNQRKKDEALSQAEEYNAKVDRRAAEETRLGHLREALAAEESKSSSPLERAKGGLLGKLTSDRDIKVYEQGIAKSEALIAELDTGLAGLVSVLSGKAFLTERDDKFHESTPEELAARSKKRKVEETDYLRTQGVYKGNQGLAATIESVRTATDQALVARLKARLDVIKQELASKDLAADDRKELADEFKSVNQSIFSADRTAIQREWMGKAYGGAGLGQYYSAETGGVTKPKGPEELGRMEALQKSGVFPQIERLVALLTSEARDQMTSRGLKQENKGSAPDLYDWKDKEKNAAKALKIAEHANEIRQEEAWSAAEIRQLELDIEVTRQASLKTNLKLIEQGIEQYRNRALNGELLDEEQRDYDALIVRQEQLNAEIENQAKLVKKATPKGAWGSFNEGVRSGVVSLGDLDSASAALGESMTTTFSGGLADSMEDMIEALATGENAWKSFSEGMGNILADLGSMIVKYMMKLLALYAVQQLVGMVMGSQDGVTASTDSMMSMVDTSALSGGASSNFAAGFGMADGGPIPTGLGVPNKDSVPAMLMPGEFVVRKDAVEKYGLDTMFRLNSMKLAAGGSVGGGSGSGVGDDGGEDGTFSLSIINVVDPRTIPKTTNSEILNVIRMDAAQNGPTTRTIRARLRGDL